MAEATVVEITADNVEEVLALEVGDHQRRWVQPVSWYVARSAYQQVWQPVAFAVDGELVGFAEWAYDDSDRLYCVGGVTVDARRQGQGLGRACMAALLELLRAQPDFAGAGLTVHEDNAAARRLYRSLGFRETGQLVDDELVMVQPMG